MRAREGTRYPDLDAVALWRALVGPTHLTGRPAVIPMDAHLIRRELAGLCLGASVELHAVIGSTNDRALELADAGAPEGLVVCAETQESGRGRLGRAWKDEPGHSLLFSVLLRPQMPPEMQGLISLAAGVAVSDALYERTAAPVRMKWPNDVVVPGAGNDGGLAKLGGILIERRNTGAALGIGINITHAPATRAPALPSVCLDQVWQNPVSRETLLVAILRALDALYGELQQSRGTLVLERVRALDTTLGQAVTLQVAGESVTGVAAGINDAGALTLRTTEGLRAFAAGEVTLSGGPHS